MRILEHDCTLIIEQHNYAAHSYILNLVHIYVKLLSPFVKKLEFYGRINLITEYTNSSCRQTNLILAENKKYKTSNFVNNYNMYEFTQNELQ